MASIDQEINEFYADARHDPDVCGLTEPEKGGDKPPCPGCVPIWIKAVLRKVAAQERIEREREFARETKARKARGGR